MSEKHREHCEEEEECIAVKGCKRGRPVKVRIEDDCEPLPVRIVEDRCDPLDVKIKQKHCDPLVVKIKQEHCEPLKVRQCKEDCWHVQGCEEGVPVNVNVVNQPPGANTNSHVFNGTTWEPELTPSTFIALDNQGINGSAPVWTPGPGLRFRLMGFHLTSSLAGQLNFRDGAGGPVISSIVLQAGVPFQSGPLGNGILSQVTGNQLILEVAAGPGPTSFVSGIVMGQEQV
jgi:hypothetical protein